jgi:uncharacterized membrane protein
MSKAIEGLNLVSLFVALILSSVLIYLTWFSYTNRPAGADKNKYLSGEVLAIIVTVLIVFSLLLAFMACRAGHAKEKMMEAAPATHSGRGSFINGPRRASVQPSVFAA